MPSGAQGKKCHETWVADARYGGATVCRRIVGALEALKSVVTLGTLIHCARPEVRTT